MTQEREFNNNINAMDADKVDLLAKQAFVEAFAIIGKWTIAETTLDKVATICASGGKPSLVFLLKSNINSAAAWNKSLNELFDITYGKIAESVSYASAIQDIPVSEVLADMIETITKLKEFPDVMELADDWDKKVNS